jgi:arylformamidase
MTRMQGRLIDISPLISDRLAVWPGDVPYQRSVSLDLKRGDNLTLGSMQTTFHAGAHADAPSHYGADLPSIEERSLDLYFGACQVLQVSLPRGQRILPKDINGPITARRILLRTDSYPDPQKFNKDFNSLSPELVETLHEQGVTLIGIDTPSVDPFDDATLASHQAIARHDMANLEGLVLTHVAPGDYTLIALPLRLAGADASPVRAALLQDDR